MFLNEMTTDYVPASYEKIIHAMTRRQHRTERILRNQLSGKWERERYFRKRVGQLKALVKKLSGKCTRLEAENHVLRIKLSQFKENGENAQQNI